jgi:DNA polymerase IV
LTYFSFNFLLKIRNPIISSRQQPDDMAGTQSSARGLDDRLIKEASSSSKPDLTSLPPTFILATNLSDSELHEVEDMLGQRGAPVTYDMRNAKLVIGNISKEKRAKFELKRGKVRLLESENYGGGVMPDFPDQVSANPEAAKRRKLNSGMLVSTGDVATVDTQNEGKATDAIMIRHAKDDNPTASSISRLSLVDIPFANGLSFRI